MHEPETEIYRPVAADDGRDGLLEKVDLRVDEYLADIGISYRIIQGPNGWLDALAGCRYTNLYQRITLHPDYGAINDASAQLVNGISQQILDKLSGSGIGDQVKSLITQNIVDRLQGLVGNRPDFPIGPVGGADPDQIKAIIQRLVQKLDPDLVAAIQAQAQAKTAALKAAAQQKVDYLKNKLAEEIAGRLGSLLNQSVSKTNYWFDPYVGFRGQLKLHKAFYLAGRADIGGFRVGSQLTWQAYAALGCQITRNIYAEAGYRCLYTDYRGGGLTYDTYTHGPEIDVGIKF